jgi:phage-related protein
METGTAQTSIKKVASTAAELEPSALVILYEIDISDLIARSERRVYSDIDESTRLRFHNNLKLIQSSIFWNGKEYWPAPINADGFETSAKGSPPTPKMSITINLEGLRDDVADKIKYLKYAIRDLDSLCGAKVTRYRTFAKYLDCKNFYTDCKNPNGTVNEIDGTGTTLISNTTPAPEGFDPDPNAFFPPDIYYIDRKSGENKTTVEFELASPFDMQDLKLPARIVTENSCVWTYRGEGCCYEYTAEKQAGIGEIHYNENGNCKATNQARPSNNTAPPVATNKNEKITDLLDENGGFSLQLPANQGVPALWDKDTTYSGGDVARVKIKGVNYYFVSKANNNKGHPPPNTQYWYADQCSKSMQGCRMRWRQPLPIGAFPTSRRGGTA